MKKSFKEFLFKLLQLKSLVMISDLFDLIQILVDLQSLKSTYQSF